MAADTPEPQAAAAGTDGIGVGVGDDLSALSWVRDELRRSLDLANKALRRYLKEQAQHGDLDTVDPAVLRQARNQLHQCVGVLELVGLGPAAALPRAAEAALQRISARPKLITPAAVDALERGSFALLDFIERRLAAKPVSALALFPQYQALQQLAGAVRVHPADLWHMPWAWRDIAQDNAWPARLPDADTITLIESDLLALMRGAPPSQAARMADVFAGLAAGAQAGTLARAESADQAPTGRLATLWLLAAACFEAQADGLLPGDAHSKRLGSRLLAQLRAGALAEPSERLAHDLLFFCSQAASSAGHPSGPRLLAVQQAYGLHPDQRVDYAQTQLGRFDPAWVAQARKRVAAAKEVWSAVAGGDAARVDGLPEQFALVSDSLARLYPDGAVLGRALQVAAAHTVAAAAEPPADLAMEVATALLYLDASIEDADFDHPDSAQRVQRLAQRIDAVRQARDPGTLDLWMEELYRRVSDRQTMGSVVQELRASLSEVEKNIDQYFRNPAQRDVLIPVPGQLQAMRGVLSVLGLEQASMAVLRMRDDVDELANTEVNAQHAIQSGSFDRLADNLGALSFLIDMVSVQPQMAKSLFRFDAETGSLSAVMAREDRPTGFDAMDTQPGEHGAGQPETDALAVTLEFDRIVQRSRTGGRGSAPDSRPGAGPAPLGGLGLPLLPNADALPLAADSAAGGLPAAPAPVVSSGLEDDPEMRDIFLEEAHEVLGQARDALALLQARHDDAEAMTTVRRAFHTLKGSARMVGLLDFGAAAWACEQLYNSRLAEHAGADADLRGFSHEAVARFDDWVRALAAGDASGHGSAAIVRAADALRTSPQRLALDAAGSPVAATALPDLRERVPDLPLASDLDLGTSVAAPASDAALPLPEITLDALDDGVAAPTQLDLPALDPLALDQPALDQSALDHAALDQAARLASRLRR